MKLFSTALILVYGFIHPLHVSVTEIEMDEKDKALEITMRVFIDDAELTFRKELNQPELDILNLKNGLTLDQLMTDYLKDHFKISLEAKPQKIKYLGHEKEDEAFIFYSEVSAVKKWKTIQIQNNMMMEIHDDQSNLVHIRVKDKTKSMRLTNENPMDKIIFEAR